MIDKTKLVNTIVTPKNTIKDTNQINVSETFSNSILDGDVSNFILNSKNQVHALMNYRLQIC